MKNFLATTLGLGLGAVGCVLYVVFYAVLFAGMLWLGFIILSWLF